MALIALDSFLIMSAVLISAFIIDNCDEYSDVPILVNLICCIVLAIEYFIMVIAWCVFNIAKFIFTFPERAFSFVIDLFATIFFKKGDDNNEKIE